MPSRSTPGRRAAPRPPSRLDGLFRVLANSAESARALGRRGSGLTRLYRVGTVGLCLFGLSLLVLATLEIGPAWIDGIGAVVVAACYTVALSVRTGGRPFVFGGLVVAVGVLTLATDDERLRAGAAVLMAALSAVLAVMATVPAVRARDGIREVLTAAAIASAGSLAVVGFRPVVSLDAFDYVSLAFAFGLGFVLVFRLGAGWHGLGRRGLTVVLVGSVALAVTLAYTELLGRYGAQGAVDAVRDAVDWTRETLGAVPGPLITLVGIPALMWGCHMRARRRQGWWVCVFGVAGTVSIAGLLIDPDTSFVEAGLTVVYSLLPGLALGYGVIRLDLSLTGPRGARARREEEAMAMRPEPKRFEPLL